MIIEKGKSFPKQLQGHMNLHIGMEDSRVELTSDGTFILLIVFPDVQPHEVQALKGSVEIGLFEQDDVCIITLCNMSDSTMAIFPVDYRELLLKNNKVPSIAFLKKKENLLCQIVLMDSNMDFMVMLNKVLTFSNDFSDRLLQIMEAQENDNQLFDENEYINKINKIQDIYDLKQMTSYLKVKTIF